jgi:hypothetical protein
MGSASAAVSDEDVSVLVESDQSDLCHVCPLREWKSALSSRSMPRADLIMNSPTTHGVEKVLTKTHNGKTLFQIVSDLHDKM